MNQLQIAQQAQPPALPGSLRPGPGRDRPRLAAADDATGPTLGRDAGRRRAGGLAGPAALPAEGEAGDLPVPVGGAVADRPVRPQAGHPEPARDRAARLGADGPADHDDDLGPEEPARSPPRSSSSPGTARAGPALSELLPHTAKVADDLCIIRSVQTEAINHDPAITFVQTGSQLAGRPSMGAWVAYGLGSMNQDLPAFVVLLSRGRTDQPLYDRLWGSGFLPTRYQGVKLRGGKEPVLYLANPAGCSPPAPPPDARRPGRAQPPSPRRDRRPGDPHARRPVRAGLPHAVVGARADRPLERAAARPRAVRARRAEARAATPPTACWPGGWPSAACGSSSSTTWAGTSTANLPEQIRDQCQRHRPALRRAGHATSSSAACWTTRW